MVGCVYHPMKRGVATPPAAVGSTQHRDLVQRVGVMGLRGNVADIVVPGPLGIDAHIHREHSGQRILPHRAGGNHLGLRLAWELHPSIHHPHGSSVGALLQLADMDIAGLDSMVQLLLQHGLAPSTQRSYSSAQARYMSFCATYHIQPLPFVQETLCTFTAWLGGQGMSHSSIKCYFSALCNLQIEAGGTDLNSGQYGPLPA